MTVDVPTSDPLNKRRLPRDHPDAQAWLARPQIVVNHGAKGIGDALLGLTVLPLLDASARVVYKTNASAWVALFDGAYDSLARHHPDDKPGAFTAGELQLNRGYNLECRDRQATPRWQRYARNLGVTGTPVLPPLREPERIRRLGASYAGTVVLCPSSHYSNREWRIEH
jgi:hypothetical protein